MSKLIRKIDRSQIQKIALYHNKDKKTRTKIKEETGADFILNGGLYEMSKWEANCHLKIEGTVLAKDPYTYWGYAWDEGSDIAMEVVPATNRRNYICCVELLRGGKKQPNLIYTAGQGGTRGRTAIGLSDTHLWLYVSGDGSDDATTPEVLREELAELGLQSALMLDCGGSDRTSVA